MTTKKGIFLIQVIIVVLLVFLVFSIGLQMEFRSQSKENYEKTVSLFLANTENLIENQQVIDMLKIQLDNNVYHTGDVSCIRFKDGKIYYEYIESYYLKNGEIYYEYIENYHVAKNWFVYDYKIKSIEVKSDDDLVSNLILSIKGYLSSEVEDNLTEIVKNATYNRKNEVVEIATK